MSEIRLLFLVNSPPVMAGVEKTVLLLLEHINRKYFDVRVILNGYGPFYEELCARNQDVEVIESNIKYSPKFVTALRKSLEERPADVVQLHLSRFYAPVLNKLGCKIVERLNMTRHGSAFYLLKNKWLDRKTAHWINKFIVVSESLREQFLVRGYPADKLVRVYNGVDIPPGNMDRTKLKKELGISQNVPMVGIAGRLTQQKGIDTFLKAASGISSSVFGVEFVVVGDGELRGKMERLATQLKLDKKVKFIGYRKDILDVMASFNILLYPSRWEPFANTILEAMAVGTPVVASNVGGNAEAIEDGETGFLFPADNAKEAATVVTRLLDDPEQLKIVAANAKRSVRKYSVAAMANGHQQVYWDLAKEAGRV